MKKVILLIMVFTISAINSDGYAKQPKQDNAKSENKAETYAIPCQDEVAADDKYYIAFGIGDACNIKIATQNAINNALQKLQWQINGFDSANSDDSSVYHGSFEITCERFADRGPLGYVAYVAVRAPKIFNTDNAGSPSE